MIKKVVVPECPSELENLGLDGLISSSQNIDNEIEVLRSKTIVKEVVEEFGSSIFLIRMRMNFFPGNMYKTYYQYKCSMTPQEAEFYWRNR